ncbi:MAG: hypothetical protein GC178_14670 [Flavobacteriales bacterium]|nr:hypothetical protein [Flavobacteriales bacterium]
MKTLSETFKWARFLVLAGAVSFAVASCNTKKDDTSTPSDPASDPPTPTVGEGYGTLSAVKTVTTIDPGFGLPTQEIELGIAAAAFFNGTDYSTFVNAGSVSAEGESLTQYENNSYAYTPSQTNPSGIDFGSTASWDVGGAGDIPAFTHTTSIGFPTLGTISSATTVPATGNYTLSVSNVTGADSVYFMLGGVVHVEAGNATSSTFTEAEIDGMGSGSNFAQVAPYKIEAATKSGKQFFFVTEKVKTQSVTIE